MLLTTGRLIHTYTWDKKEITQVIIDRVHEFGWKENRKPIQDKIRFSYDRKGLLQVDDAESAVEIIEPSLMNLNGAIAPLDPMIAKEGILESFREMGINNDQNEDKENEWIEDNSEQNDSPDGNNGGDENQNTADTGEINDEDANGDESRQDEDSNGGVDNDPDTNNEDEESVDERSVVESNETVQDEDDKADVQVDADDTNEDQNIGTNNVDDDRDGWTNVVPGKHSFVNPQLNSTENNHEELDDTIPNIEKRATENDVEISGDIE